MMLNARGHDILSAGFQSDASEAQQRNVVAFRRAAGEQHIAAIRTDDLRHNVARMLDSRTSPRSVFMGAAAGVPEVSIEMAQDLLANAGIERCRRSAIQVDRGRSNMVGHP